MCVEEQSGAAKGGGEKQLHIYKHGQHRGCRTTPLGPRQEKEMRQAAAVAAARTKARTEARHARNRGSRMVHPEDRGSAYYAMDDKEVVSAESVLLAVGHDDHHSPIAPKEYLELRVKPHLMFYQSRLPRYAKQRYLLECAILFTSLTATLLAFLNLSQWAPVAAASATALTAHAKYKGPDKKLQRLSEAIAGVEGVLLWWGSLTEVEHANIANVNTLVTSCEEFFRSERQAWVSTAMQSAAQMTAQAAGVARGERERMSSSSAGGGDAGRRGGGK